MTLDDFENKLSLIKNKIEKQIQHPYIEKFIDKPLIDPIKLSLLINLFQHVPIKESLRDDYIVSSMLIQMAGDTHELVPATNHFETPTKEKEKQLLVLAGDYYSGLHYLLLAKTADFSFIRLIATTVKTINELKMELFYRQPIDFIELVTIQKKIHSIITQQITKFYTDFTIDSFIGDIILTNLLLEEKQLIIQHNQLRLLEKLSGEQSQEALLKQINEAIHDYFNRIEEHLKNPMMQQTLNELQFDQLFQRLKRKYFSFVEEG